MFVLNRKRKRLFYNTQVLKNGSILSTANQIVDMMIQRREGASEKIYSGKGNKLVAPHN